MSDSLEDEMEADSLSELLENLDLVEGGLQIEEKEFRSDACVLKNHDCTRHRHSCCHSKMFKFKCTCFYKEGNDTSDDASDDTSTTDEEICTCQQVWYHALAEDLIDRGTQLLKNWIGFG
ncbi:uncharacterized protein TNCV_4098792 [Trichonephila clavipes]|nr:uncharacterized protein TNCV_4098792 [Trichonephila clavipes]